ncbi:MAG TPA: amidohydrolase family protein [Niastella sp.]
MREPVTPLYLLVLLLSCTFVTTAQLPIKTVRSVSFNTTESSYTDVDVSPDGKELLVSFWGQLYKLPVNGGTAKRLTHGLEMTSCPVWSPNGKLIAYVSDVSGFIRTHVQDLAGTFHKVFGENEPQNWVMNPIWLPDGKQVAVHPAIYDLSGGSVTLSADIQKVLGFSADSRYMYYIGEMAGNLSAVIRSDRSSGAKTTLMNLPRPYTQYTNARISPDLQYFTFMVRKQAGPFDSLMVVDLASGKEKLLVAIKNPFVPTWLWREQHYSITKDSRYLFIGYGGKIHRIEIKTGKDQVIPFTVSANIELGPLNYNTFPVSLDSLNVKYIRSVQKSPDGKRLVFSALSRIYIMDLPNGKPKPLIDQPFNQFEPAWSPDGKWITYVTWDDKEGGQLWRIAVQDGVPEQLTAAAGLYMHPSWSPDGNRIVVAKGRNRLGLRDHPGNGQMVVVTIGNKEPQVIADTVPLWNNPVFLSDGKHILYTPKQAKGEEKIWPKLVSYDPDNNRETDLVRARNLDEKYWPLQQVVLSPDGKYVVFSFNQDLYLSAMNNPGIDTPRVIFDYIDPFPVIRFARGATDPVWDANGKTVSWVAVNRFCSIDADKIMNAAKTLKPNAVLKELPDTKIIDVNLPADELITIDLKAPREYGNGMIAFKNARIISMQGNKVIENGTVLIKNGRIIGVEETAKIMIPAEAQVFDLSGQTIIPGFIDTHNHMFEAVPPDVFLQQSWQRLLTLSYGVTTIRDPSGSFDTFGYGELVETGQMMGPRLFTVGQKAWRYGRITSAYEGEVVVKKRAAMGATVIKQYSNQTRLQRQLLLMACRQVGVNMTNEVEKDPLYCLGMIKDGSTGVEHNPIWGDVKDDIIKLVAKSGTFLTPTLQVCYGKEEGKHYFRKLYGQHHLNRSSGFMSGGYKKELLSDINATSYDSGFLDQSRIDARIKHAGGKIIMGSHGEDPGVGAHWEVWALQMGGLSNFEALQTATITAAEALGMQKDLGSIETGKIADLIILNKNPLDDIHNTTSVKYVMKAGVLYESETLDEVWPVKKQRPANWR